MEFRIRINKDGSQYTWCNCCWGRVRKNTTVERHSNTKKHLANKARRNLEAEKLNQACRKLYHLRFEAKSENFHEGSTIPPRIPIGELGTIAWDKSKLESGDKYFMINQEIVAIWKDSDWSYCLSNNLGEAQQTTLELNEKDPFFDKYETVMDIPDRRLPLKNGQFCQASAV